MRCHMIGENRSVLQAPCQLTAKQTQRSEVGGKEREPKSVERIILCYAKKPNMPELRASDDSASHHGES
jgi:hypothetical protein